MIQNEQILFEKSLVIEDFVPTSRAIVQDYRCPLCLGIYMNPVVDSCGHVFCQKCIEKHRENTNDCPITKHNIHDSTLSHISLVADILEKQDVLCKNRIYHCQWTGKLADLQEHLDVGCNRQIVPCHHDRCDVKVFREDLTLHQGLCEYRIIPCPDCNVNIAVIDITFHQAICPMFKVDCPQACHQFIERQNIQTHIEHDCMNTIVRCPFASYGCHTEVTKRELSLYLSNNINSHHQRIISALDVQGNKIDHHSTLINSLKEELNSLKISQEEAQKELQSGRSPLRIKSLHKKRQRLDGDLIMNDIEIASVEGENLEASNYNQVPAAQSINNSTQSNLGRSFFDVINISKGLFVQNFKAACLNNMKPEHRYVFANISLNNREREWKVTLNSHSTWIALGVCNKELVIANKMKFVTTSSGFNNGTFAISTNGYTWNCNNPAENNAETPNSVGMKQGESIVFKYVPSTKLLHYSITDRCEGVLTQVYAGSNSPLVPCAVFLNSGDEVTFDLQSN